MSVNSQIVKVVVTATLSSGMTMLGVGEKQPFAHNKWNKHGEVGTFFVVIIYWIEGLKDFCYCCGQYNHQLSYMCIESIVGVA
jgi:hypothetical protein